MPIEVSTHPSVYAGVGSRATPDNVIRLMRRTATELAHKGWILRSGAARGADCAFEDGCNEAGGRKEIYLPWNGFSASPGARKRTDAERGVTCVTNTVRADAVSRAHWPGKPIAWDAMRRGTQALMRRNACQVLGAELKTPALAVLYWTPLPESGGTTQALRIARAYQISCVRIATGTDVAAIVEQLENIAQETDR